MIVSVSRRTDIPAYFSDWFFNRLRAGFALVRNPYNPRQVRRVALTPDAVDGFVFWTKDPRPMLDRLDRLRDYAWYMHVTVTGYGPDIEPNIPDKDGVLIPALRQLAACAGPERLIWRYDPILCTVRYDAAFHVARFAALAQALQGCTHRCVISFVDDYRSAGARLRRLGAQDFPDAEKHQLAAQFADIARAHGLQLETCAETIGLEAYGIGHGHCVDRRLLEAQLGRPLAVRRDRNQRPACGCDASVDIGAYDTCPGGCAYCYATHAGRVRPAHDPDAPALA